MYQKYNTILVVVLAALVLSSCTGPKTVGRREPITRSPKQKNLAFLMDQHTRGMAYFTGKGGVQDYQEARRCFEDVAKHANKQLAAESCNNLGVIFENGLGAEKDHATAEYWYKRAVNFSLLVGRKKTAATAAYNLAMLYYRGFEGPIYKWRHGDVNKHQTLLWLDKAIGFLGNDESAADMKLLRNYIAQRA